MTRHLIYLVCALIAISLTIFFYKLLILEFPLFPDSQTKSWLIEAEVHYQLETPDLAVPYEVSGTETGSNRGTNIRLNIPAKHQSQFIVENESFGTGGFGYYMIPKKAGHRQLVWSISSEKTRNMLRQLDIGSDSSIVIEEPLFAPLNSVLYYKAYVRPRNLNVNQENAVLKPPPPKSFAFSNAAASNSANEIINAVRRNTAGDEAFIWGIVRQVSNQTERNEDLKLLSDEISLTRTVTDFSLMVLLLREAGYPTRIAYGVSLREDGKGSGRDIPISSWLEVYYDNQWHLYHPSMNAFLDDYAFALWYDEKQMLNVDGGAGHKVVISMQAHSDKTVKVLRQETRSGALSHTIQNFFYKFSLFSLPLRMQDVYKFLLVVPLGALMIILFRNVIGLQTFGTFMPVLVALAFRETGLITGVSLLVVLLVLGLSVRFYFSRFKLLLVPRLGSMLIVVLLLIVIISLLLTRLGLMGGLSVTLFPMVILTMVIERMSIMWEERGAFVSTTFTAGTLFASIVIYLSVINRFVEHIVFVFPELLLLCLALALLLGRYSGYRLMELFRFRTLIKEISDVQAH